MRREIRHEGFNPFAQPAILDQIVEAFPTLEVLQAVDHRKPAIVADHHNHFVARKDGAVEVGVHHHVGAVTDKDDQLAIA